MKDTIFSEKLLEEAEEHVLTHHVSLGGASSNPAFPSPIPDGSGTFVKFSISCNQIVYGILTAAHVARWLKFGQNEKGQFVGLSRLQNGDTIACSVTFPFIYHVASKHHFHLTSKEGYLPDIAFIALGLNKYLPVHELIENSSFYDLDDNKELELCNQQVFSSFCKGAGKLRPDGLIDTCITFGGGEFLKFDEKIGCQYWEIPNTSGSSIAGASGAGFWRFIFENGILRKSLEGVIIAEGDGYDYIEAMETSYLYDSFLPELKKYCAENISWFL